MAALIKVYAEVANNREQTGQRRLKPKGKAWWQQPRAYAKGGGLGLKPPLSLIFYVNFITCAN